MASIGWSPKVRTLVIESLETRRFLVADFGDAPAPYPTSLFDHGASHTISSGLFLGSSVDAESDGFPTLEANGDDLDSTDDENGVAHVGGTQLSEASLLVGDTHSSLEVEVSNLNANPFLDAWIDFNQDGDWDDANERILSQSVAAGRNIVTFAIPTDALLGTTYARFRLHSAVAPMTITPTGLATAGEVEDYRVHISFAGFAAGVSDQLSSVNLANGDQFGNSVAIDGDTAVVGAPRSDLDGVANAGAVFVFVRKSGGWSRQGTLVASDRSSGDAFGYSVDVSGDTIVVGAVGEDGTSTTENGAAYVFTRNGSVWTQQKKLTATTEQNSGEFGNAVTIDKDTIAVAAKSFDSPNPLDAGSSLINNGAVFVFIRNGTDWLLQQEIISTEPNNGDAFGFSVDLDSETLVVGARGVDSTPNFNNGAAYVWTREATTWTEQGKLLADDRANGDSFGYSVAVSNDTLIVGAIWNSDAGTTRNGAAYVFTRRGNSWSEEDKLLANDKANNDFFGQTVAIEGDRALVGAYLNDDGVVNSGAAYLFSRTGSTWVEDHQFHATTSTTSGYFGWYVDLSEDAAIISSDLELATDSPATSSPGKVQVIPLRPPVPSDPAPTITSVRVSSALGVGAWTTAFNSQFDADGLGYPIPHGPGDVNSTGQLAALPWSNIQRILIQFSEDVVNVDVTTIQLTGLNLADYTPVVSYDSIGHRAVLTLPSSIDIDRLTLVVQDAISDNTDQSLDGEWGNGISIGPSGNGIAGGNFYFQFNVVAGDTNQSGVIAVNDLGRIRVGLGSQTGDSNYSIFADLDGSGGISVGDVTPLRGNLGRRLPNIPAASVNVAARPIQLPRLAAADVDAVMNRVDQFARKETRNKSLSRFR